MSLVYRFYTAASQVENRQLAVGWGPCGHNVTNLFGELFTATPHAVPNVKPLDAKTTVDCESQVPELSENHYFSEDETAFFDTLSRNLHPSMQERLNNFKAEVNWASTPVLALYVRGGNMNNALLPTSDQDFVTKKRGLGMELEEYIQRHLEQLGNLADVLGYGDNYRIFLATDEKVIQETFMRLAGPARGIIRPQTYVSSGHPMLWKHLGLNNKGKECNLDWFTDPVLDNMLLGEANALVLGKASTFYLFSASMQYARGRLVCETWPFGCNELRLISGIGQPTSHDYYCYQLVAGACPAPGPNCRTSDTPVLKHVLRSRKDPPNGMTDRFMSFLHVLLRLMPKWSYDSVPETDHPSAPSSAFACSADAPDTATALPEEASAQKKIDPPPAAGERTPPGRHPDAT
eukprot:CAMPEP_0118938502 /NCGR_PEP_ID=MMETSP1169-20130426/26167_1 /TAXON_ID=36882 /ORGANISM="Pyramimonas obovata, Strain CCMP722" /LENGTH=404 /DNA_ID=CAMNT_0006882459 /DNA_START=373 /DNA_END=1583 /DNA_ORIENTATION=+